MYQFKGLEDTIAAIATPSGAGGIGIVRISGKQAIAIAEGIFRPKSSVRISEARGFSVHYGWIVNNDEIIDEVLLTLMRSPKSYTGEDVVEISCHGSPFIQQQVMDACIRKGARIAKPGEFTQRAFLLGKMDLAQAEAVADVIASNTAASQQTSLTPQSSRFIPSIKKRNQFFIPCPMWKVKP